MKKLLVLLGLCGMLVACNNGEVETLKKELEDNKVTMALYEKALLNPDDYDVDVWEGELRIREKSEYDKVRDEIMKEYEEPKPVVENKPTTNTVSITKDSSYEPFPQDLDTSLRVSEDELIPGGDPDDEANNTGSVHYVVPYFQEPKSKYENLYVRLETDYEIDGIMSYCVEPTKRYDGYRSGSDVYIGFKLKKK